MTRSLLLALLLVWAAGAQACTVCGCSASNPYLGILPQFHRHFIGLQAQYRSFESKHLETSEDGGVSQEYYRMLQVWGRYQLGKKIQLFGYLPYVANLKNENGKNTEVAGPGDVTLLANYQLLNHTDAHQAWKQNLQLGGGLKLPTGVDNYTGNEADGLPNMQPGTGTWDVLANLNYTIRHRRWGMNVDASYTLTTAAPDGYKFGNRLSAGATCFFWHSQNSWHVLPQAGLRLDIAGTDYDNYQYRIRNDMSGGLQLYSMLGIQTYYKQFGFQLSAYLPLTQHYAGGMVRAKLRSEAGIFFLL